LAQVSSGETFSRKKPYRSGILPPGSKALLVMRSGRGVGVGVGVGVDVGVGVGVGVGVNVWVGVGGMEVGVGGGVAVGDGAGDGARLLQATNSVVVISARVVRAFGFITVLPQL